MVLLMLLDIGVVVFTASFDSKGFTLLMRYTLNVKFIIVTINIYRSVFNIITYPLNIIVLDV